MDQHLQNVISGRRTIIMCAKGVHDSQGVKCGSLHCFISFFVAFQGTWLQCSQLRWLSSRLNPVGMGFRKENYFPRFNLLTGQAWWRGGPIFCLLALDQHFRGRVQISSPVGSRCQGRGSNMSSFLGCPLLRLEAWRFSCRLDYFQGGKLAWTKK